jgi:putative redox protein
MIDCETETPNTLPQTLHVRAHTLRADLAASDGGTDSAPGPHDYFDAALAACKALTATWYARKHSLPLERVETHVERDAVGKCPIHKLMTTTDVIVETAPLGETPGRTSSG